MRAADFLPLSELNRALSAWLSVGYHQHKHSEINHTPQERYEQGLTVIRKIDMHRVMDSFMQSLTRTINRTFPDVQINKRFFRVDPNLRGDRVQVRFDPFSTFDQVQIYSMDGQFLGTGVLHHRRTRWPQSPDKPRQKPAHNYTDLLLRKHSRQLAEKTGAIDYRKVVESRPSPFFEFADTVARLLGLKAGLTDLCPADLEALKKVYNHSRAIDRHFVKKAFEKAQYPSVPYIVAELKQLIAKGT